MSYRVEYLHNDAGGWNAFFVTGKGFWTEWLTPQQFVAIDEARSRGEFIFLNVEVIE